MQVYELIGILEDFMTFVVKDELNLHSRMKSTSCGEFGVSLIDNPPELILQSSGHNQKKYKGKARKIPDIGHFTPGGLIISQKAKMLISDYLLRFGELKEIVIEDVLWYNYVVTNALGSVVDMENSIVKKTTGVVSKPQFLANKLPAESEIFKSDETGLFAIYFNDPENDSDTILSLAKKHGLKIGDTPLIWDSKSP